MTDILDQQMDHRVFAYRFDVTHPASEDRNHVCQEQEEQTKSYGELRAFAEGASRQLCSSRRRASTVTTFGKRVLHEVAEYRLDTIVRSALGELDQTEHVGSHWDLVCHFPQRDGFLFGRQGIHLALDGRSRPLGVHLHVDHAGAFRKAWILRGGAIFDGEVVVPVGICDFLRDSRRDHVSDDLARAARCRCVSIVARCKRVQVTYP